MQRSVFNELAGEIKTIYLSINIQQFHYLKFILEAYDNMGILSKVAGKDASPGSVLIRYSPFFERELFALLTNLAPRLKH